MLRMWPMLGSVAAAARVTVRCRHWCAGVAAAARVTVRCRHEQWSIRLWRRHWCGGVAVAGSVAVAIP